MNKKRLLTLFSFNRLYLQNIKCKTASLDGRWKGSSLLLVVKDHRAKIKIMRNNTP